MASADYDVCESHVLASEGGYTNDARDPGGPTNWGITIFDARMYWKHDATAQDIKEMPKAIAQDIYRKKYWATLDCDDLPAGLDYSVFDYGVNSGIARSGKVLRRVLNLPSDDWHVTADVLSELAKHDAAAVIAAIDNERLQFLESLKTWDHFGKGWGARVASVKAISLRMAAQSVPGAAIPIAPEHPPAPSADVPAAKGVETIGSMFEHHGDTSSIGDLFSGLFHSGDYKV